MIRLRHKLFIILLRLFDQLLLITVLLAIFILTGRLKGTSDLLRILQASYSLRDGLGIAVLGLGWILIFNALVHYETNRLKTLKSQLLDVTKANSAAAFLLMVVSTVFPDYRMANEMVLIFWGTTCTIGMISRLVLRRLLMQVRRSGYNFRHLLILGHNQRALQIAKRIDSTPELGYKIVGFVSEAPLEVLPLPLAATGHPVVGSVHELKSILEQGPVDELAVCLPILEHSAIIGEVVRLAQELGIVLRLFPETADAKVIARFQIERFEGDYVVTLFREQMLLQLLGKRLMDLSISALLLVGLSPLLLVVAAGIKLTSPGPVLFVQQRVGMNKRMFRLYKFRSMFVDAEARRRELIHLNEMDGPVFKIRNDPRVTSIGRFIRKTSIDELPQLINVFRGHMSLVGPRPPLLEEVDRYEWLYRKRLSIKPGVTCFWQISGRNEVNFKQWMEMDQSYINNWSLWLDVKILAKTVPAVLFRRGAS